MSSFVCNADGLRVQKTVNGVVTDYPLHGKNVVHMTSGGNELHFFYDAANKPAVVVYNGTAYAYVKNLQGDIIAILDQSGNAVVQYAYDAWGKPISTTGSMASTLGVMNPFRYRGYVYDEETGLYYLRSRYYNPAWGRFVNADILLFKFGQLFSSNIYAYCLNRPVAYIDKHGFEASACEHAFIKNTYCMTGEAFYSYLLWQYERHPNIAPTPPIIEALKEMAGMVADKVIESLDNWFTKGKKTHDYAIPILGPFMTYNNSVEEHIVNEMVRSCSGPYGYQSVKVEILYGSHSAEVRLTLTAQNGTVITCNVIKTQGYDVILDMMDCMKFLVDSQGGEYYHEHVDWKYSMEE